MKSELLLCIIEDDADIFNDADKVKQVDAVILDFAKAFDTVPHKRLLHKLRFYGIRGSLLSWMSDFLTNREQTCGHPR